MNSSRPTGVAALPCALALGLFVASSANAEVAVARQPDSTQPQGVYVLDAVGDDPTPITTVWKRVTVNELHVVLNAEGDANGDGQPSLVTQSETGLVVAAWSRNSTSGFDVVTSRFVDGAWTAPAVVVGSPANELDPQLVLDPDGSVHLFYWVDGPAPQVFHTVAPADLSAWSAPDLVSQPGVAACRPAGVYHDGVLRVAYERHDLGFGTTPREVVLAHLDNGSFVTETVASTDNLGDARPQVHSHAGHLWVDWVDAQGGDGSGEMAWTRLNTQGNWEPIHYEPFASTEQRDYIARGAARIQAIQ